MKSVFLLPTIRDNKGIWKQYFVDKMIPSMERLKGLPIDWAINFQLYDDSEIKFIVRSIKALTGAKVYYTKNDYTSLPISCKKLRHDSAVLCPDADLFILIDDDFVFRHNVADYYAAAIKYFEDNPACGYLQCKRPSSFDARKIVPTLVNYWGTNRGFFIRNLGDGNLLYDDESVLDIPGAFEQQVAVFCRMERGFFGAKTFNVPVSMRRMARHEDFKEFSAKDNYRYDPETSSHNPKNNEEIVRYIINRWGDSEKPIEEQREECIGKRLFPKLKKAFNENCLDKDWKRRLVKW